MARIKSGKFSASVDVTPDMLPLLQKLFRADAGRISVDVSWGDIPEDASDIQLNVCLHSSNGSHRFSLADIDDADGDGVADSKAEAWNEYFMREYGDGGLTEEELLELMPESMVEPAANGDDYDMDGDFLSEGDKA